MHTHAQLIRFKQSNRDNVYHLCTCTIITMADQMPTDHTLYNKLHETLLAISSEHGMYAHYRKHKVVIVVIILAGL